MSDPSKLSGESLSSSAVRRRFLVTFVSSGVVFAAIIVAILYQDVRHQQILLERETQHLLDLQEEMLRFEFQAVQSDLLYLAHQEKLTGYLSGQSELRSHLERDYASFAQRKAIYDQIRCLDPTGQEIIRVNYHPGDVEVVPQDKLQSKATRYYYQQALKLQTDEVFVSPFDLNVEHGRIERPLKPVIRFLTPVFDTSGTKKGLLVLNYLGTPLLSKLRQASYGYHGETMLINGEGEYLQASNSALEWGWLLGHPGSFRRDFPMAWERGRTMDHGAFAVGSGHFGVRHISPGSRVGDAPSATEDESQDSNRLTLVAYVSPAVARVHSRDLLAKLGLLYLGGMMIVALLAMYWARSSELRRHHEHRIAQSESRLRQLSSALLAAQEAERRKLSRLLHDEIGQQVTALSLDLRSLAKRDGQHANNPLLERAIEDTKAVLRSLHEIASRVRPSVLDDLGLRDAVESFLTEFQQRTGIQVRRRLDLPDTGVASTIGENTYRILQEALVNVATHANVRDVGVELVADENTLTILVSDEGGGFDVATLETTSRLGVLGMRERVELLNGRFELQSAPGEGTRVWAVIPLRSTAKEHVAVV